MGRGARSARWRRFSSRNSWARNWTPALAILVVINVAMWLIELVAFGGTGSGPLGLVVRGLMLDAEAVAGRLQLWQLASYMFLHDPQDPLHLLFNMLVLYWFGGLFERRWGTRDFLRFYLLSGVISGVVGVLAALIAPGVFGGVIVGASGALSALLMAFAMIYPDQEVRVWFVLPIKGRQLVLALVAIDLLMFLTGSDVAIAVHAGGLLAGWLLITGSWRWSRLRGLASSLLAWRRGGPKRRGRFKVYTNPNTRH